MVFGTADFRYCCSKLEERNIDLRRSKGNYLLEESHKDLNKILNLEQHMADKGFADKIAAVVGNIAKAADHYIAENSKVVASADLDKVACSNNLEPF